MIALLIVTLLSALGGCANHTVPIAPKKHLTTAEKNFEIVWEATQKVLRKYEFTIDRQDRRAGVIVTELLTGAHLGEFWRHDAATTRDRTEGTIQTIYRQVKVTIEPAGPGSKQFKPFVEARTFRSNRHDMQVVSMSEAINLFKLPGTKSSKNKLLDYDRDEYATVVSPLGRDENLQRQIAADILKTTRRLSEQFK